MKISGDLLALDLQLRHQIESESRKLTARFPDEALDPNVTIQEEFDSVHGHRTRCELIARLSSGRQMIVRDARKIPTDAIREVFFVARHKIRELRRQTLSSLSTTSSSSQVIKIAGH